VLMAAPVPKGGTDHDNHVSSPCGNTMACVGVNARADIPGFDPSSHDRHRHLRSMHRVFSVGTSVPGEGTGGAHVLNVLPEEGE
jgi:hypothetical protein